MNNIRKVRKVGLWVIVGVTLMMLLVLNVIQETACLNEVVWGALFALAGWFIVMAVVSRLIVHKGK